MALIVSQFRKFGIYSFTSLEALLPLQALTLKEKEPQTRKVNYRALQMLCVLLIATTTLGLDERKEILAA